MTQLREFMATPKRLLMKRQVAAPGQWADGISLACRNSTVTGNTITGATEYVYSIFKSRHSFTDYNSVSVVALFSSVLQALQSPTTRK